MSVTDEVHLYVAAGHGQWDEVDEVVLPVVDAGNVAGNYVNLTVNEDDEENSETLDSVVSQSDGEPIICTNQM